MESACDSAFVLTVGDGDRLGYLLRDRLQRPPLYRGAPRGLLQQELHILETHLSLQEERQEPYRSQEAELPSEKLCIADKKYKCTFVVALALVAAGVDAGGVLVFRLPLLKSNCGVRFDAVCKQTASK